MLQPLREREFRLLWAGQTVSLIGDGLFTVALVWQTLELSSAPAALGVVTFARAAPRLLLLLLGGVVSDRVSRRRLMLVMDLIQFFAVALIAALGGTGQLVLWHVIALAIVVGIAQAFLFPTLTGIVPEVVSSEQLVRANALYSGSRLLAAEFAGPALGGVLVSAFGAPLAFGVDAASFAVSALALVAMRSDAPVERERAGVLDQLKEGIRYTRSQRWLWIALATAGIGNFFLSGAVSVLGPLFIRNDIHADASGLGAYFAAIGLGGGIGVLISGHLGTPRKRVTVIYLAWVLSSAFLVGLGVAPGLLVATICAAGLGLTLQYGNVLWVALLQELVPRAILGRVSSLDWFVSLALDPVSVAVAAPIAAAAGASSALIGAGIAGILVVLFGLTRPGARDPEEVPSRPKDG